MSGPSPPVQAVSWGSITIEGVGAFKDAKVWPGGGRGWDWGETGTRHRPGVQPDDLAEVVDRGAEVVVIGRGMLGRLGVPDDTLAYLTGRGVDVVVEQTEQAVRRYEDVRHDRPAGGVFHTTC